MDTDSERQTKDARQGEREKWRQTSYNNIKSLEVVINIFTSLLLRHPFLLRLTELT